MTIFGFDYETFNEAPISVGVSRYARDPSLEIILASWSADGGDTVKQYDRFRDGDRLPNEFLDALEDERLLKMAWNFPFEWNVTSQALGVDIPAECAIDPMVLARALSLPGSLAEVCRILNMPEDEWKHGGGKALINYFCQPRKPTKKNPSRRNTDKSNPEKWQNFKGYNQQDIRAMFSCWYRMKRWNLSDFEWSLWEYDRHINEAGIPVNLRAIGNANRIVDALTEDRAADLTRITGLDNANSGPQLLGWLKDRAYPFNDLKIGHVRRALKDVIADGDGDTKYATALQRRTEVSKASLKKFAAYGKMADDDGLLRNALVFNGAGRTCRWSGSGVQPHNMARPHWFFEKAEAQEALARHIARLDARTFEWLYSRVDPKSPTGRLLVDPFEALSSGVRGIVAAPDGHVFVSADFNAIENRVLGYMAHEERILDVFRLNRDPYVDFATYMFGGTYDELWHEYKVLGQKMKRQTSKPGVLGCFGPDTPVLTDRGWVRLVEVSATDLVHDGVEFVRHGGVAFRGRKPVLNCSGVYVTSEHELLCSDRWVPACRLESRPNEFREALATASGLLALSSARLGVRGLSTDALARAGSSETSHELTSSGGCPRSAPLAPWPPGGVRSASASEPICSTFSQIVSTLRERGARTQTTQLFRTTAGAEFVCGSRPAPSGSPTSSTRSERTVLSKLIVGTTTETTPPGTFGSPHGLNKIPTSDTWDVVDAGPRRRFVVLSSEGPLLAHNCGYMLGEGHTYEDEATGEILATGLLGYAWNMGIADFTQEQASRSVQVWRQTYSKVSDYEDGLWYELDRAVRRAITTGRRTEVNMFEFEKDGPFLTARLPSGRKLYYLRPRLEDRRTPWGDVRPTVTYEGIDSRSTRKAWGRISTHPGKVTENLDQAIARDALAYALMRLRERNIRAFRTRSRDPQIDVRLHVHDEIVALAREDDAERVGEILSECMSEPMDWAPTLPLKAVAEISNVFVKT